MMKQIDGTFIMADHSMHCLIHGNSLGPYRSAGTRHGHIGEDKRVHALGLSPSSTIPQIAPKHE